MRQSTAGSPTFWSTAFDILPEGPPFSATPFSATFSRGGTLHVAGHMARPGGLYDWTTLRMNLTALVSRASDVFPGASRGFSYPRVIFSGPEGDLFVAGDYHVGSNRTWLVRKQERR